MFLPAAGYNDAGDAVSLGNDGEYWSSTPYDSDLAYNLYFISGVQVMDYNDRYYGYSVRAVLAE